MTSSDVYLIVSTLSLIILTACGSVALMYCILILRRVYRMMDTTSDFFVHIGTSFRDMIVKVQTLKETIELVARGVSSLTAMRAKRSTRSRRNPSAVDESGDGQAAV